jgi:RNA polymerase sigma-70 factor (ECF subfamily)
MGTTNIDSDDLLVERARARDAAAFDELMGRHDPMLRRLVSRIVEGTSDQDEAMQNALLAAWCNIPKFEGRAQFGSWMYRVTTNAALMTLRSQHRKRDISVGDIEEWERTQQPQKALPFCDTGSCWIEQPEQAMQRKELRALLEQRVMDLSPILREVFVLRHVDGLSIKECASQLRLSGPAVKTRLHRACLALRAAIHRNEADVATCRAEDGEADAESRRGGHAQRSE